MTKRARGAVTQAANRRLLKASPTCHICGRAIDLTIPLRDPTTGKVNRMCGVVDHVIPLAKGGPDTPSNKRPAHWGCNQSKSDREYAPIVRRSGSLN